jgi:hypothetical protein
MTVTMDEIAALLDELRATGVPVVAAGPAPGAAVREVEAVFGQELPPSYRAFLLRFGALAIGPGHVSGIADGRIDGAPGRVWHDTRAARADRNLPVDLLVVESEYEEPACLDFGRAGLAGECPVARFHHRTGLATVSDPSFAVWLAVALRSAINDRT